MIKKILTAILLLPTLLYAQINTERVMTIARNALYFEIISLPPLLAMRWWRIYCCLKKEKNPSMRLKKSFVFEI
jgi:hypothetical protein